MGCKRSRVQISSVRPIPIHKNPIKSMVWRVPARLAFTPFAVILRREGGGHTGGHTFCENPNKSQNRLFGLWWWCLMVANHRVKVVDTPCKVVDTHRSGADANRTNDNAPLRPRTHLRGSLPVPVSRRGWRRSAVRLTFAVRPRPLPRHRSCPSAGTPGGFLSLLPPFSSLCGGGWSVGVDGWAMGDAARLDGAD